MFVLVILILFSTSCYGMFLDGLFGLSGGGSSAVGGLVMGAFFTWLTIRRYRKLEKTGRNPNKVMGWILIVMSVVGVTGAFSESDVFSYLGSDIGFLVSGILLLHGIGQQSAVTAVPAVTRPEPPEPQPAAETPLSDVQQFLKLIGQVKNTQQASKNPGFLTNLTDCDNFTREIVKSGGEKAVNKQLLDTGITLLKSYLDTQDNKIQTDKTLEIMTEIEKAFIKIRKALESIYNNEYSKEGMNISSEITALNYMLNQQGLLGSDFESDFKPESEKSE